MLWPSWREAAAESGVDQAGVDRAVDNMGRAWLNGCGFSRRFERDGKEDPLYRPLLDLRVTWGEWGPEHITIPGDATGLDICNGLGGPPDGKMLAPHNVDNIRQAHLLLVVFLFFADTLVLNQEIKFYKER